MDGGIGVTLMLPIMVDISIWFKYWGFISLSSGSWLPEIIPDNALWIDEDSVLVVDTDGTYLLKE